MEFEFTMGWLAWSPPALEEVLPALYGVEDFAAGLPFHVGDLVVAGFERVLLWHVADDFFCPLHIAESDLNPDVLQVSGTCPNIPWISASRCERI